MSWFKKDKQINKTDCCSGVLICDGEHRMVNGTMLSLRVLFGVRGWLSLLLTKRMPRNERGL